MRSGVVTLGDAGDPVERSVAMRVGESVVGVTRCTFTEPSRTAVGRYGRSDGVATRRGRARSFSARVGQAATARRAWPSSAGSSGAASMIG